MLKLFSFTVLLLVAPAQAFDHRPLVAKSSMGSGIDLDLDVGKDHRFSLANKQRNPEPWALEEQCSGVLQQTPAVHNPDTRRLARHERKLQNQAVDPDHGRESILQAGRDESADLKLPEGNIELPSPDHQAQPSDQRPSASSEAPAKSRSQALESNEPDEFQLLEERLKQETITDRRESPAEQAERQLRERLEAEKILLAKKAAAEEQRKRDIEKQQHRQIRDDQEKYQEYKDNIDHEINAYTLPDQYELNWSGLAPPP